jgi:hypothetical protein
MANRNINPRGRATSLLKENIMESIATCFTKFKEFSESIKVDEATKTIQVFSDDIEKTLMVKIASEHMIDGKDTDDGEVEIYVDDIDFVIESLQHMQMILDNKRS